MYSVVGCPECSALWVVEGRPETTRCPRCGSRRQFSKLRRFVTTDDADHARGVRAAMLADRSDGEELSPDSFAAMADDAAAAGVDDEEYLSAAGLDPDAVAAAGDRATEGTGGSRDHTDVVRSAVRDLEEPTREAVLDRAAAEGVDHDAAGRVLDRLRETGEAVERDGVYRLL